MSTKKACISNFFDILKRLHEISGKENEYEIAELLGFKKDTFAARKSRGSIPAKEIKLACVSNGWNFEWVMCGKGPKRIKEERPATPDFPAIGDYQLSLNPVLVEVMELLLAEPPETAKFVLELLKSRKTTRAALKKLEKIEG